MSWAKKYSEPIKSALWGIAGLIVSLTIISTGRISVVGYPLFLVSILMFVLAGWQLVKAQRKQKR
jgi:hypothetical protein